MGNVCKKVTFADANNPKEHDELLAAEKALREAVYKLPLKSRIVLKSSPFCSGSALEFAFGEKPSLLWLLPFRPGHDGSPLNVATCNAQACKDWIALGHAIQMGRAALGEQAQAAKPDSEVASLSRRLDSGLGKRNELGSESLV